jgi:hypothetical protein
MHVKQRLVALIEPHQNLHALHKISRHRVTQ